MTNTEAPKVNIHKHQTIAYGIADRILLARKRKSTSMDMYVLTINDPEGTKSIQISRTQLRRTIAMLQELDNA